MKDSMCCSRLLTLASGTPTGIRLFATTIVRIATFPACKTIGPFFLRKIGQALLIRKEIALKMLRINISKQVFHDIILLKTLLEQLLTKIAKVLLLRFIKYQYLCKSTK
jgi:hypothetical protein